MILNHDKRKQVKIITRTYNNDGTVTLDEGKYKDIFFKNLSPFSIVNVGDIVLNPGESFGFSADEDFFSGELFSFSFTNTADNNKLLVCLTKYNVE